MAIVKTIFTAQTLAAQAAELLAYLQANADEYFDTISADGDGNISCYVGETLALKIGMDGTTTRQVTLANGQNISLIADSSTTTLTRSILFSYAKKTANGVMLVTNNTKCLGADTGPTVFIITQNELGDTCICGRIQNSTTSNKYISAFCADIKNDATIFKPLTESNLAGLSALSKESPVTATAAIIFSGGHYAPKAFFNTFSQFALTQCDININGKSYASDGVMMISD